MNVNLNLIVANVIRMKTAVTINVCVSAKIQKKIKRVEKITFGILLNRVVKMVII